MGVARFFAAILRNGTKIRVYQWVCAPIPTAWARDSEINVLDARAQLSNAMKKVSELSLAGDVERVELVIPKGAKLKGNFDILDGYLVKPGEGNERVTLDGFKNLIMVIEL